MASCAQNREKVAIIGLGRSGTAVGCLLRQAGYPIVAVTSRSSATLSDRVRYTGGQTFTAEGNADAAALATCIVIATPDDAIASVCADIDRRKGFKPGDKVIHLSGAGGLDLLEPARQAGASVASIHPLQSFADVKAAICNIPKSRFGVTAGDDIREWCFGLVRELGGIPFFVPDQAKPLYHAAACMASNYLTTLLHMAEETYLTFGMSRSDAIQAFWPLVLGTLRNVETRGSVGALTGPISRGDAGTIEQHVRLLRAELPAYLPAYCAMGLLTVDLALKKKTCSPEKAATIKAILTGA